MFETITPEAAGISSRQVEKLLALYERHGITLHSVLMMRGNKIFSENYWAPFTAEFCHRMYSQTKSFVGVAIGLLEEDGKLSLDDKIASYFADKIDGELPPYLAKQTIRQMLTMTTCGDSENWFLHTDHDRCHIYFNHRRTTHPAGTLWQYDSPGSQVLCVLAERLSGMPLLDYLKKKIFNEIGSFQTATMLKTPTGESWGDSAMVCTPRDMLSFARFVMNYGTWNGKRLMNEAYLRTATSRVVDNDTDGHGGALSYGYGYQIWRLEQNSFGFIGMGDQLTICVPDKDFIFTCTADNQGAPAARAAARAILIDSLFDGIVNELSEHPLAEDSKAKASLDSFRANLKLRSITGEAVSPFEAELNGAEYVCDKPNPQKITHFSFVFHGDGTGEFRYTNEQGDKVLPFGMNHNVFGKFPQDGYSDEIGTMPGAPGFRYNCAVSAAWREEKKLILRIQIIDRYFGNSTAVFAFRGDEVAVCMTKAAEAFLNEYTGTFVARRV